MLGHTLVVPTEHAASIQDLAVSSLDRLWRRAVVLAPLITEAVGSKGFNLIQSNGAAAEQTVPHVHVHILPRSRSDRVGEIWPDLPEFPAPLVDKAWKKVRNAVKALSQRDREYHTDDEQPRYEEDAVESRDRP